MIVSALRHNHARIHNNACTPYSCLHVTCAAASLARPCRGPLSLHPSVLASKPWPHLHCDFCAPAQCSLALLRARIVSQPLTPHRFPVHLPRNHTRSDSCCCRCGICMQPSSSCCCHLYYKHCHCVASALESLRWHPLLRTAAVTVVAPLHLSLWLQLQLPDIPPAAAATAAA